MLEAPRRPSAKRRLSRRECDSLLEVISRHASALWKKERYRMAYFMLLFQNVMLIPALRLPSAAYGCRARAVRCRFATVLYELSARRTIPGERTIEA